MTVTPGAQPVVLASDLRPGQHLAVLGADARGKAEVELAAIDERRRVEAGIQRGRAGRRRRSRVVGRDHVTALGDVIVGHAEGRRSEAEVTLFDSTGLAIQDLAIAISLYEGWRGGDVEAQSVAL